MKLRTKIMMISILPIVVLGVFIFIFSKWKVTSSMEEEVFTGLRATATAVRTSIGELNDDPYVLDGNQLMKGDVNLTQSTAIVDDVKASTDIVTTIFFGDTRYATSVKNAQGERALYTTAGKEVVNTVVNGGEEYHASNVEVVGTDFYAYYLPLKQAGSDEVIGMVFCGKNQVLVESEIRAVTMSVLIGTIVVVLLAGAVAFFVATLIAKALDESVDVLAKVSNGDLTTPVSPEMLARKDELGKLSECIERMRKELSSIVGGLKNQSLSLFTTSDKLNKTTFSASESVDQVERAIQEIAIGATSQADETQKATENVILMGNMVEETSEEVNSLIGISEEMLDAGNRANETLSALANINKKASNAIEVIYEQTNTTNESAMRIREATNLITEIADETNLLSLNASIEAARAGEQGRGFAVVAGQISKLAEQSNESAHKIEEIITVLIKDSQKSVETMEEMRQIMREQDDDVRKTQNAFEDVRLGIEKSTEGMNSIAEKTRSLDEARVNVVDVVQNLTAIAEENAAGTQETSASATEFVNLVDGIQLDTDTLKNVAEGIDKSVSIFRL